MPADNSGAGPINGPVFRPRPKQKATVQQKRRSPSRSSGGSSRGSGSSGYRRNSGGGSSGGRSFSGSGGSSSYSPPKPPSIADYLKGDSAYQQALSGSKRSYNDYVSDIGRRKGEAGTQYKQTKGSMERDRLQQLDDLRQEYASRGLINSGIYGDAQSDFQTKFMEQLNALDQQQAALLADLVSQQKNYKREYDLANQQAKQDALLRRSQKYGIG